MKGKLLLFILNYIIMFWRKKEKKIQKPSRSQSLDEWKKWLEKATLKQVFLVWQDFIPRSDGINKTHDMKINELLEKRLFCIDFPICRLKNKVNSLKLPNDVDNNTLKDLVKNSTKTFPYLLIEKNGRYRGIALESDVIFVGTSWVSATPRECIKRAQQLNLRFLTKSDSLLIEKYWKEINSFLDSIGAATLQNIRCWLLETDNLQPPFEIWKLSEKNRCATVDENTLVKLFLKL